MITSDDYEKKITNCDAQEDCERCAYLRYCLHNCEYGFDS